MMYRLAHFHFMDKAEKRGLVVFYPKGDFFTSHTIEYLK